MFLDHDNRVRRIVFAPPDAPYLPDQEMPSRFGCGMLLEEIDYAAMRAMDGDGASALPISRTLQDSIAADSASEYWKRKKAMVAALVECLEHGEPARTVLGPMAEAAKAKLRVRQIKPRKAGFGT